MSTAGFEDTIAIGRQTRSDLYDWFAPVPVCLVPRGLRFGVAERVGAGGEVLGTPADGELRDLAEAIRGSGAKAVAISQMCIRDRDRPRRLARLCWPMWPTRRG